MLIYRQSKKTGRVGWGLQVLLLSLAITILVGCSGADISKARVETKWRRTKPIWMMGRSVMVGWFDYWGSDGIHPVKRGRFRLTYKKVTTPPKIVNSVRKHLERASSRPTVFFKLCFADFEGGSRDEARANLARNKTYIRRAYRVVVNTYHKKLLVGNALPKVAGETDSWLVWNHRQYNAWLENFAASHPRHVYIFNQYDILKNADGALRPDYASSADDSHPNDAGYTAMDAVFFPFLRSIF